MGYINAQKINNDVLVWEKRNGKREVVTYRAPYYFYTKSKNGTYTSIYKDKLERHDFATGKDFNVARAKYANMGIELFESDIPADLKILSEKYYNKPAPELNVTFFDIEVDYDKEIGYATVQNPYGPINSVALYNSWQNRMVVYAVPPEEYTGPTDKKSVLTRMNEIAAFQKDCKVDVNIVNNEEELLLCFLEEIKNSDVISGWNSEFFDVPYIGKRLEMMGREYLNQLSFPEGQPPKFREVEMNYRIQTTLDLSGRISADYMAIFKKYEVVERPSFKLEAIAEEILIDPTTKESVLPKLEYEGSLASLYRKDFLWFIRYNLRDTEILKGFEDRLGYIELANQMCHLSTGLFKHVTGTIKLSELATINYCHYELNGMIVNDVHVPENTEKAKGAFVLLPQIGEHEWIGAIDINSLYPSAIRSINISPETIIGQFVEKELAYEHIKDGSFAKITLEMDSGEVLTAGADEWREALKNKKWSVSGYGTVFSQEMKGIMPSILEYWYAKRKEYQKLYKEAIEAGDKIKSTYYDKLQYVYKIKLNSYYGSLLNAYFRFYDKRLGESTTATSRAILLHQCAQVIKILDGKYISTDRREKDKKTGETHIGYSDKWSVIYGDTDSTYFKTKAKNKEDAILIADYVGEEASKSFPEFMRNSFLCSEGFDNIIKTGREIVSDKGIFVDKKRYFLHIVDVEGYECDKCKIMGLDTKKTTLPREISKVLNKFIERYLKGESWDIIAYEVVDYKDVLLNTKDIMTIGLPKGVKNVEQYTRAFKNDQKTRLPGHVAASIFYNMCRSERGDKESPEITSGMKIKVFYLNKTYGRFKSIAIPVDIEQVPEWFLEEFNIHRKMHIERLVDNPFNNIIKAIGKEAPSKQSLLNDQLLGF